MEIVLLKVAFTIFDRTVFDRSVPSSPVQWPMAFSLEVKRMSFPVVFVAIQSLTRTMLNGLVAIGGDDLLEELLAEVMIGDMVGIRFEQFQLIVNVVVPLIMLIPIQWTAFHSQ